MLILFFVFAVCMVLIWFGWRKTAIGLAMINLAFCAGMLIYHATDKLGISL